MELKDTVDMMLSSDYKEQMKAEYWQVDIRINSLSRLLENWDNLDFEPTCPKKLLELQLDAMCQYASTLATRAALESVDLLEGLPAKENE
jgi:hypothetical protein